MTHRLWQVCEGTGMDDDAATPTVVPFNFGLTTPEEPSQQGLMYVPRLGAFDLKTTPPGPELELPPGFIEVPPDGKVDLSQYPEAAQVHPDGLPDVRGRIVSMEPGPSGSNVVVQDPDAITPEQVAESARKMAEADRNVVMLPETERTVDESGTTRIKLGPTVVGEHRWEGEAVIPTQPITVDIDFDTQAERQDAADSDREFRRAERELARIERERVPVLLHHFELPGPVVSSPHRQDDPDVSAVVMERAAERKARRNHVGFDWGAEEREGPRRWSARIVAGTFVYCVLLLVYLGALAMQPSGAGSILVGAFGLAAVVMWGLTLAEDYHVRPHVREFLLDIKLLREDV